MQNFLSETQNLFYPTLSILSSHLFNFFNKSFKTFYLSLRTFFSLFSKFSIPVLEFLAFHLEKFFNPLSVFIYTLFITPFIPLSAYCLHNFRTSWINFSKKFIRDWDLLFPYFSTSSSQFLNFLHSTMKTSFIVFLNVFTPFSELLLSNFECFTFKSIGLLE